MAKGELRRLAELFAQHHLATTKPGAHASNVWVTT